MIRSLTLAAASIACFTNMASAHDSYIHQRFGDWAVVNGHGTSGDDAYEIDRILNGAAHDASGGATALKLEDRGTYTALQSEGAAVLAATFYSGFWTKDTNGDWHNEEKSKIANADSSGEYARHAVAVIGKADTFTPFGLPLEIVPQANPLAIEPGNSFKVQVLHEGKPLEGAKIGSALPGVEDVTTNADGIADVIVREGLNILLTSIKVDHPDQTRADTQKHGATLSFVPDHDDH